MCGGVSAISVFFPLNNIRTRLQVESGDKKGRSVLQCGKDIVEADGIAGLYQGWWSAVVCLGASNFVYFYTYNGLKSALQLYFKRNGMSTDLDPVRNLMIASFAGVINVLVTTPLWVVNTRLMTQTKAAMKGKEKESPYTGVWNCLSRIYAEEGLSTLWNSVLPSLVLVSNPSIQFVVYENLRKNMVAIAKDRNSPISAFEFFIMGAIAKAVATVCTYPLQIAQSKLRADRGQKGERQYKGTIDCLIKIRAANGWIGWFKGMEAKLWQTVLTAAFQFLTYEQIKAFIFSLFLGGEKMEGGGTGFDFKAKKGAAEK